MNRLLRLSQVAAFFFLLDPFAHRADAQSLQSLKTQQQFDAAIAALDTALFDAYNRCDLAAFSAFFEERVEMYHDLDGVISGKGKLTRNIKKYICGGDVRRELVPGSLEVYPMKGYGAVAIGMHRFVHPKSNAPSGEGKFINLWRYKNNTWKITRVISFDHHEAK